MTDSLRTESSAATYHVEGGARVYPCRCGKTHRGTYAFEDWNHHNCLHDASLTHIPLDDDGGGDVMCPLCGASWEVHRAA